METGECIQRIHSVSSGLAPNTYFLDYLVFQINVIKFISVSYKTLYSFAFHTKASYIR